MKQFFTFVHKEFLHIFRDIRTTLILLVMPLILIIFFGYAITTEVRCAPFAVLDGSHDALTQKMTDRLKASEYFDFYASAQNRQELDGLFRKGKIRMAVVFPPQYAAQPDAQVQILADATDPNEATQLTVYASAILSEQLQEEGRKLYWNGQPTSMVGAGVQAHPRFLYNPQMKGAYFFVPGVMGLILILICAMMTSVGIVREKESGTMEVLLVSPLKPIYFILAKAVPYLLISFVNIATILALSSYLFDLPIRGSLLLLIFISVLYAIVALSLGLLISVVADSQQSAMLISGVALMLPVILLSGMMFPVENMPDILQWISHIVPAKWYIIAVKDVMIKGLPVSAVLPEIGILAMMAVVLLTVSVKKFNTRL